MSGIAGILHFDGRPAAQALLHGMTAAMDYRGPNGITHFHGGSIALGHCALVTTREQLAEQQPLQNESGKIVLVFDGRIDNRTELRRELLAAGAHLRDDTDAELVLRAYEQWDADCVQHLDGEFAFVAWDARTVSAFCARDRMGIRPFHYHWDGSTLVFASDVHAILGLPWVPRQLNVGMVAEALAVEHLTRDETFWTEVFRLPAATIAVASVSGVKMRRYWEPDPGFRLPCSSDEDYVRYHRELLHDVLRRQSRSHLPIACEVSGGLDSSAVFAVARALRRGGSFQAPGLHAFALSFTDAAADESAYRKSLSEFVGEPIEDVLPGSYPIGWYRQFGGRFGEFAGFPNWTMLQTLYAAAREKGCRVVFNGSGGDEWLGSVGDWPIVPPGESRVWTILRWAREDAAERGCVPAATDLLRWSASELVPEACKEWIRHQRGLPVPSAWLSGDLTRLLRRRRANADRPASGDTVRDQQLALLRDADGQFGRELAERQAAVCGIERRQPFWDRRIVEAAFATPEWLRARDGRDKWLHRRTMQGLLPPHILEREDKADFRVIAQRQRTEVAAVIADIVARRPGWVDGRRMRHPDEYVGSGSRADFGQWALLMADALEQHGQRD